MKEQLAGSHQIQLQKTVILIFEIFPFYHGVWERGESIFNVKTPDSSSSEKFSKKKFVEGFETDGELQWTFVFCWKNRTALNFKSFLHLDLKNLLYCFSTKLLVLHGRSALYSRGETCDASLMFSLRQTRAEAVWFVEAVSQPWRFAMRQNMQDLCWGRWKI